MPQEWVQSCKWWKPLGQCRPVLRCGLQQPGQQGAGRAIGGKESTPEVGPGTLRQGPKPAGESVGCKADPHFPLPVISLCSLQLAALALPYPSLSLLVAFPSLDLASSHLLVLTVSSSNLSCLWLTRSHCLLGHCPPYFKKRKKNWGHVGDLRRGGSWMPTLAEEMVTSFSSKINPFSKDIRG